MTKALLIFTTIAFVLTLQVGYGNMASPIQPGTKSSSAFTNQHVEILKETINIEIGSDFKEAKYNIRYKINALKSGYLIPIIFQAEDYKEGFKISIDGIEINQEKLPTKFQSLSVSFKDYEYINTKHQEVKIHWTETETLIENLKDLIFFELDLTQGEHTIDIEYVSTPWIDYSNWIKEYTFRYSLSPAKYWKKFGDLEVNINTLKFEKEITTNLNQAFEVSNKPIKSWKFDKIPQNTIVIKYVPEVSKLASIGMLIGPHMIAFFFGILLLLFHAKWIQRNRKKSKSKYSKIVIIGALLFPFILFVIWINTYELIDILIGENASRRHGYLFLVLLLSPFVILIHLIIAWRFDAYCWRKNQSW